jgi:hypothetical protein
MMDKLNMNKKRKKGKSMSVAEKRQKDNERKRSERQKLKENPEEYEKARAKESERYKRRKKEGKLKSIAEKSKRQQRQQRKNWRINAQTYRAKKKCIAEEEQPQDLPSCSYSLGLNNLVTSSIEKKEAGRKRVLNRRNAANRKIRILENALDAEKKKSAKYKKRYQRLQETKCLSPRKKVKHIMLKGPKSIKRQLLFNAALVDQLIHNSKLRKTNKEKFAFTKFVTGKILKKYRLTKLTRAFTFRSKKNVLVSNYQRASHSLSPRIRKSLLSFFQDDENSTIAPGKNDCITKCKIKKQKR